MKMLKSILALIAGVFLLAAPNLDASSSSCDKVDPLVGVWLQNQTLDADPSFVLAAQVVVNADHTLVRNIDVDLQRVINDTTVFPEGTVFSISDDYSNWKRISKHSYRCVGTQIVLIKQEDGTFEPLARAKCEITFTVHGNTMTGKEVISFYDYYDLTLTVPFQPLPPLSFTIEGKKLKG